MTKTGSNITAPTQFLEKPSLAKHIQDPQNRGYAVLQRIFFAPTTTSHAAGEAFIARLMQRRQGR
jgi:hypothetical protein